MVLTPTGPPQYGRLGFTDPASSGVIFTSAMSVYKHRNVVERCFNRLKQFRGLATRYAKRAAYYHAELTIAAIILWLR
ncbi:transposase [Nocardia pneumoniae]|uniref:transposase n=1 Tax=Nocardia pneumoniae TaxID=228601 RepID=UPI00030C9001